MLLETIDSRHQQVISALRNRVLQNMENNLNYHKMLARYTKKTTKLNLHLENIRIMEEVIKDYKLENNL